MIIRFCAAIKFGGESVSLQRGEKHGVPHRLTRHVVSADTARRIRRRDTLCF